MTSCHSYNIICGLHQSNRNDPGPRAVGGPFWNLASCVTSCRSVSIAKCRQPAGRRKCRPPRIYVGVRFESEVAYKAHPGEENMLSISGDVRTRIGLPGGLCGPSYPHNIGTISSYL